MDIQAGKQKGIQLRNLIKSIYDSGWIELLVRWFLGVIFVYASHYKILAPADFAKIVYGYDLFPGELINLIAIIVPFIELIVGLALIAGCGISYCWLWVFMYGYSGLDANYV